ncbi:MAG: YbbR-like domain-containing protein [Planctomycetes bacterium]|nr:YbbR-like domain-containing protein [Planctomycetota bacterium]
MIQRLRQILTEDLQTKGMALLLALLLWSYVNAEYAEESPVLSARLSLEVPEGVLVLKAEDGAGHEVDEVSVILKGSKGTMRNLAPRELVCRPRVILSGADLAATEVVQVQLGEKDFDLPPGIRARVTPGLLRVTVAPEGEKVMRVLAADCLTGTPEEGFRVARVEVSPSQVRIRGPRHVLRDHSEIGIAKIDVTRARESFSQKSRIQPRLDGENVFCTDSISVVVTVDEAPLIEEYTGRVSVLLPATFPYRFEPRPAEVSVRIKLPRAERPLLNEKGVLLVADPFDLYADPTTQMQPGGTFKVPLRLRIREGGPKNAQLVEALQEFILYIPPEEKPK